MAAGATVNDDHRRRHPDQLLEQRVERLSRVVREASVDLGGLDDRAGGRHQPAEPLGRGSAAIGPASGSPAATLTSASRWARPRRARASGASAASRALVERHPAPRKPRLRQNSTTPALNNSLALDPRNDADHRVVEGLTRRPGTLRLFGERRRVREPPAQVRPVRVAASPPGRSPSHSSGTSATTASSAPGRAGPPAARRPRRSSRRAGGARARRSAGTARARARRGPGRRGAGRGPRRDRSATCRSCQTQQVRVPRGAVDVRRRARRTRRHPRRTSERHRVAAAPAL